MFTGSAGWMGGMRNQQPVHMGMPYNNFASYYGQEVPYGGYSSYPDNGMSDSQGIVFEIRLKFGNTVFRVCFLEQVVKDSR